LVSLHFVALPVTKIYACLSAVKLLEVNTFGLLQVFRNSYCLLSLLSPIDLLLYSAGPFFVLLYPFLKSKKSFTPAVDPLAYFSFAPNAPFCASLSS